jgi:hypothetical protein
MTFSKVDVTETGSETATVTGPSLDLIPVRNEGRSHARGQKGTLAVRPQFLAPTEPCAGMLHGKVALAERLGSETVLRAVSDAHRQGKRRAQARRGIPRHEPAASGLGDVRRDGRPR